MYYLLINSRYGRFEIGIHLRGGLFFKKEKSRKQSYFLRLGLPVLFLCAEVIFLPQPS